MEEKKKRYSRDQRIRQLREFYEEHGHSRVPTHGTHKSLGKWCANLRREQLTDEQVEILNSLNFVWSQRDLVWYQRLEEYKIYNTLPPENKQDVKKWAYHQREQKDKGLLSRGRLKDLNDAGFRWDRGVTNFLCLAMSYPKNCRGKSLENIYEMTQKGVLEPIDGRDGARLRALEEKYNCRVYSLSMQNGTAYDSTRHIGGDFSNHRFLENTLWGSDCVCGAPKFKQFHLGDYKRDFEVTNGYITSQHGVIFLPFNRYTFQSVVDNIGTLRDYFVISFLQRDQLHTHALWEATKKIPPETMTTILGKESDQEEQYCKLSYYELKGSTNPGYPGRDIFHKIGNVDNVRMMRLTVLRKFHDDYKPDDALHYNNIDFGVQVGGFTFNS
eukprot:scaffold37339_cov46-Cyclotella_meneghiniana.AAC.1